jgi:hypothetical protein
MRQFHMCLSTNVPEAPRACFSLTTRPTECFPWGPLSTIEKNLKGKEATLQGIAMQLFSKQVSSAYTFTDWKKRLKAIGPELQEIATFIDQNESRIPCDIKAISLFQKLVLRTHLLQKKTALLLTSCQSPLLQTFILESNRLQKEVIGIVYYSGYTEKGLKQFQPLIADLRTLCTDPYPTHNLPSSLRAQLFTLRSELIAFIKNELSKFPSHETLLKEVDGIFQTPIRNICEGTTSFTIAEQLQTLQEGITSHLENTFIHGTADTLFPFTSIIDRLKYSLNNERTFLYKEQPTNGTVKRLNELQGIEFQVDELSAYLELEEEIKRSPHCVIAKQVDALQAIISQAPSDPPSLDKLISLHSLIKQIDALAPTGTENTFFDKQSTRSHRIVAQAVSILSRDLLAQNQSIPDTSIEQAIFVPIQFQQVSVCRSYIIRKIILHSYFSQEKKEEFDITLAAFIKNPTLYPTVEQDTRFQTIVEKYEISAVSTTLQTVYLCLSQLDPNRSYFSNLYYFAKARQLLTHSSVQGLPLTESAMKRLTRLSKNFTFPPFCLELAEPNLQLVPSQETEQELFPHLYRELLSALWPDPEVPEMQDAAIQNCDRLLLNILPFGPTHRFLQLLCGEYALMKLRTTKPLSSSDTLHLMKHLTDYSQENNEKEQFFKKIHGILFMEETLYGLKKEGHVEIKKLCDTTRPHPSWETVMRLYTDFSVQPESCRTTSLQEIEKINEPPRGFYTRTSLLTLIIDYMKENLKIIRKE